MALLAAHDPVLFEVIWHAIIVGFAMALIWFALVAWMFRRLRLQHPAAYAQIGAPSLFGNNSPRNALSFLKFLFSSAPRDLGDTAALRVAHFMRVWFVLYLVLFL